MNPILGRILRHTLPVLALAAVVVPIGASQHAHRHDEAAEAACTTAITAHAPGADLWDVTVWDSDPDTFRVQGSLTSPGHVRLFSCMVTVTEDGAVVRKITITRPA